MPGIILTPESELNFTLSASEETAKCTMTLRHPGDSDEYYAFKVKTTQPRRYLVRPNQGLIAPGSTEKVAIMLVEKDKNSLLQSYERLGQSALDHAKDKFLVQSCTVSQEFSSKYMDTKSKGSDNTQLYEALNTMWSSAGSGANKSMENKKLHVRLAVKDGNNSQGNAKSLTSAQASMLKPHETSQEDVENMTPPQLFAEISSLRKKYDELVSFSVNLTAERDILNNTLEQTKRELNKEMANRSALENKGSGGGGDSAVSTGAAKGNFIFTLLTMLVVGAACFGAGVREAKLGRMDFIVDVPHIGELFVPETVPSGASAAAGVEATKERILDSSDD